MKNKTKKISCMLVVVCILATMFVGLSVSVQAATSVSVSTFTQLETAVNDPDMDIIIINNNIVLEDTLYIDHDIKLIANRSRELLSCEDMRHFETTKSVNISFNNIILEGSDYGGGIGIGSENGPNIDVTIENPNIQNCHWDIGGAISFYPTTNLTVLGGVLKNNSATYGGALYASNTDNGITDLYGVVIEGNSAEVGGGGIFADYGIINMYSCILENNTQTNPTFGGGGVCIWESASVYIYDSEFSNNTSAYTGGAIYNNGNNGSIFAQNTTFEGNISNDDGGCIYNNFEYSDTFVDNCTFIDNTSQNGKGGAIYISEYSSGDIDECIFTGNTSKLDGGAIYSNGDTSIDNCTISNNTSLDGAGGAVFFSKIPNTYWGSLFLNNCNINNNTSMLDGGAIYYDGEYNPNMFSVFDTTFSDNYSEAGGYYMYLPADITAYNSIISETTASAPFYYAFNNYDISYTNGIPVPV